MRLRRRSFEAERESRPPETRSPWRSERGCSSGRKTMRTGHRLHRRRFRTSCGPECGAWRPGRRNSPAGGCHTERSTCSEHSSSHSRRSALSRGRLHSVRVGRKGNRTSTNTDHSHHNNHRFRSANIQPSTSRSSVSVSVGTMKKTTTNEATRALHPFLRCRGHGARQRIGNNSSDGVDRMGALHVHD